MIQDEQQDEWTKYRINVPDEEDVDEYDEIDARIAKAEKDRKRLFHRGAGIFGI